VKKLDSRLRGNNKKQKSPENPGLFFAKNFYGAGTQVGIGIGRVVPVDVDLVVVEIDVRHVAIRVVRTRILLNSIYFTENQKMIFCVIRLKPATFMGITQGKLSRQFLFVSGELISYRNRTNFISHFNCKKNLLVRQ
jgi:hypothetical protein